MLPQIGSCRLQHVVTVPRVQHSQWHATQRYFWRKLKYISEQQRKQMENKQKKKT